VKKLILASLFTLVSSVAFASSTVVVTFTSLSNDVQGNGTTNSSQGTTYNGETTGTVAGISSVFLVCDDFSQQTNVPSSAIDFSVNTISTITASNVDFDGGTLPNATTISQTAAYDTVALLVNDLEQLTPNTANTQAITDYQYAIWYLMEPTGVDGGNSSIKDYPLDSNAKTDLTNAYAAVQANSTATQNIEKELVIYTPTSAYSSNQEFVGLDTPTMAPEPGTWLLMALFGLLLCIPQVRSRLSANLSSNCK
jgi:hypothetical protein